MRFACPQTISVVLLLAMLVAGCGTTSETAQTTPAPAVVQSAVPEAAPEQTTGSALETAAPTAVAPTVAPTITVGPTATAFPLAAGWWDDAVCYEIFVRSFYDSDGNGTGDLKGLIEKLDYLNDGDDQTTTDLGVNCLWLMPVAESPSSHGYDVVDYRTIDQEYGTNDDFKTLMDEAHRRDMHVIVDLVLNHTSSKHPWFQEAVRDTQSKYRDWYIWSETDPGYRGPWGDKAWHSAGGAYFYGVFWDGMPDLNYRNPEVTREAQDITRFWVEEMGVDGFRLDAIKHLIENGQIQENTAETHAWLRDYRTFLQGLNRPVFTVGEIFGGTLPVLATYFPDQLDSFFNFNIAAGIVQSVNTGKGGGVMAPTRSAITTLPFQRFAPFLTNHDQDRVMGPFGSDIAKAKLAATTLLALPGIPFLYYGEEIGMLGVRGSGGDADAPRRAPMQWSGDATGGFTTGQPWQALGDRYEEFNVAAQDQDPGSLLNHYRRVVQLHRTHPALGHGDFVPLETSDSSVAAFVRHAEDEDVLVVLNFNKEPVEGLSVRVETSVLAPGTYQLQSLLDEMEGAPLLVGPNGEIGEGVPIASLAPRTGYLFTLTTASGS